MRIGDVPLHPTHHEAGVQAAATACLDHFPQPSGVGRLAAQAEIRDVLVRRHPVQHAPCAVQLRAFLVPGDEQADRPGGKASPARQALRHRVHEGGDRALHVAGAAPVQRAVDHRALERRHPPALARRHHVGMAGEAQMRRTVAEAREQVRRALRPVPERQGEHGEAEPAQRVGQHRLRPVIGRGDGRAADQRLGQRQRPGRRGVGVQSRNSSLIAVLARVRASTRFTITAQARDGCGRPSSAGRAGGIVPGTTTE